MVTDRAEDYYKIRNYWDTEFCHSSYYYDYDCRLQISQEYDGNSGFYDLLKYKTESLVYLNNMDKADICAGDAIVRSLGGKVTSKTGKEIIYDSSLVDQVYAALNNSIYSKYFNIFKNYSPYSTTPAPAAVNPVTTPAYQTSGPPNRTTTIWA